LIDDFFYTIPWRASSPHPGAHASALNGGADEFSGLVNLMANPQPKHIDVRASIQNPLGQWMVRSFRQRSSIQVQVIADLSGSMRYTGCLDKAETVSRLVQSIAWSAYREGDRFGFQAADQELIESLSLPCRLYKGGVPELYTRLRYHPRKGQGVKGLLDAASRLGRARSLVFFISDFHQTSDQLRALMQAMSRHDVVPIVIWDRAEFEAMPTYGLVVVEDPETGEKRRLFMRPWLREQFQRRFQERRDELRDLFAPQGRTPLFLTEEFSPDQLTRYFLMSR
jgi:uncharacterized protein (DUF58 family)